MKRFIAVLVLLVMVVAISGCTSNVTSNKTYNANGVTFTYPGNATELNSSSIQSYIGSSGVMLAAVGDNKTFLFGVAKVNIGSDQQLASINDWATSFNKTIKANNQTYITEKTMTVDGVKGKMMAFNDSSFYYRELFFIKNNTGYLAILLTENNDQALFENIINSLQITK